MVYVVCGMVEVGELVVVGVCVVVLFFKCGWIDGWLCYRFVLLVGMVLFIVGCMDGVFWFGFVCGIVDVMKYVLVSVLSFCLFLLIDCFDCCWGFLFFCFCFRCCLYDYFVVFFVDWFFDFFDFDLFFWKYLNGV